MRVVAGSAGGIPLHPPPSPVRPTMDRVREAIFSSLGEAVVGAKVLDLFAGAGSLGIEALSRGAASAAFVDHSKPCVETIRRNLAKCRLEGEVHAGDALRFLDLAESSGREFDLIFADPPYAKRDGDKDWGTALLACPHLHAVAASGGLFVLECFHLWQPPASPGWRGCREKRYGETSVRTFLCDP